MCVHPCNSCNYVCLQGFLEELPKKSTKLAADMKMAPIQKNWLVIHYTISPSLCIVVSAPGPPIACIF